MARLKVMYLLTQTKDRVQLMLMGMFLLLLRINKIIILHPEVGNNLRTKVDNNRFNIYRDVSLKTTNISLTVAAKEKSEDHLTHQDSPYGNYEYLQNLMAVH